MKTLFQICVIICVALAVLNVAINFVQGLGIFPPNMIYQEGLGSTGFTNSTFENLTSVEATTDSGSTIAGVDAIFYSVLTVGGLAAIVVAWITRSTAIIGVWILSTVFWYSYIRTHIVLELANYIPPGFLLMGGIAMGFIWAGAIAGMLSGSG